MCPIEMGGVQRVSIFIGLSGLREGGWPLLKRQPDFGGVEASPEPVKVMGPFCTLRKGSGSHLNDKDKNVRQRNAT